MEFDLVLTAMLIIPIGVAMIFGYFLLLTSGTIPWNPFVVRNPKCVAEVWIEWPVCRGSTLYRRGFQSFWAAKLWVKYYAWILDGALPKWYLDQDLLGKQVWYDYEYGIYYGVRLPYPREMLEVRSIWSPFMPGSKYFSGEHSMGHPSLE